ATPKEPAPTLAAPRISPRTDRSPLRPRLVQRAAGIASHRKGMRVVEADALNGFCYQGASRAAPHGPSLKFTPRRRMPKWSEALVLPYPRYSTRTDVVPVHLLSTPAPYSHSRLGHPRRRPRRHPTSRSLRVGRRRDPAKSRDSRLVLAGHRPRPL